MSTGGGGYWINRLPSTLSLSTSGHVGVYSSMASTMVMSGAWQPNCDHVDLSSVIGAKCACGKFTMEAAALPLTLPMKEIRQVVTSGYRLTHGLALTSIRWQTPRETKKRR